MRVRDAKPVEIVAYDFETTKIQAGTPRPLYITAYGREFSLQSAIRDFAQLTLLLETYFLTPENIGIKFVAWNANNFDAYFIAAALLSCPHYVIRPYLTRSNALRGLRVVLREDVNKERPRSWEFLDGMAMLGLVGVSLEKFLANFAPDFGKLKGTIDFEREEFDPSNPNHCAYAFRDSEGLYHAMVRAQSILIEHFNQPLAVTMGGACIKIFRAHIPRDKTIYSPKPECLDLIRTYVMRGGFCYCVRRHQGRVWKYDINQAYAAAMRDAQLPAGSCFYSSKGVNKLARVYIARIDAKNNRNKIPFYYRGVHNGRVRSLFSATEIKDTWLTSIEIEQLQREHWDIRVYESWTWEETFQMREYVDKLERGRTTAPGGPSGPQGTVYKNVGNHSYGKTVEQLDAMEYVLSAECPEGFVPYYANGDEPLEHVFMRKLEDSPVKDYHQPQVGAFITAHVRMVVRRAALLAPDAWLYADTDCVVFSEDVTDRLDVDAKRYGAWKIEESGTPYQMIAKKVYAEYEQEFDGQRPEDFMGPPSPFRKCSAKGMNVKRLHPSDFYEWFKGDPPSQMQTQRNNFVSVMQGVEMYRSQTRRGTRVEKTT